MQISLGATNNHGNFLQLPKECGKYSQHIVTFPYCGGINSAPKSLGQWVDSRPLWAFHVLQIDKVEGGNLLFCLRGGTVFSSTTVTLPDVNQVTW